MTDEKPAGEHAQPDHPEAGKDAQAKPDADMVAVGEAAAKASLRDGRTMSGLARVGLLVGGLLLVLTVLIGMIPALNESLILQDDLIRKLLFCISVGLILASLGDY